ELKKSEGITARNKKRADLELLLIAEAGYVQCIALGDKLVIESAGMETGKDKTALQVPEAIKKMRTLTDDQGKGNVLITHDAAPGNYVRKYHVYMNDDPVLPEEKWMEVAVGGKLKHLVT